MSSEDSVFISKLTIPCRVGIPERERSRKQTIVMDIRASLSLREAGNDDDVTKTLDYSVLRLRVVEFVRRGEFRLLEAVAQGVASIVLENPSVDKVMVRVSKKRHSQSPLIGVEVVRTRTLG